MRHRLLLAALIALLASGNWLALAPRASAHPPLRMTGQNQSVWYEPAPARECRKILQRKPSAAGNYVGCRYRFVRTRAYYVVDYPAFDFAADWRWSQNWVRMTGPFSAWTVDATIFDRFDGNSVWMEWQRCRWSGVGFTVQLNASAGPQPPCALWNDGGGRGFGFLEFGVDFNVNFLTNGFPVSFSHWIRADVGLTGQGFHVTND